MNYNSSTERQPNNLPVELHDDLYVFFRRHFVLTYCTSADQNLGVELTDTCNAIRHHEYTKAAALYKKSHSLWHNPPWQPWNPEPRWKKTSHFVNLSVDGRFTKHLMPKRHISFLLNCVSKTVSVVVIKLSQSFTMPTECAVFEKHQTEHFKILAVQWSSLILLLVFKVWF